MLPGVGAFGACARALRESGLEEPARAALAAGVPFLGICVGFQLLYEGSEESPGAAGPRRASPAPCAAARRGEAPADAVEHAARCAARDEPAPLRGLGAAPWVYFVHSYAPPIGDETVAVCDYGGPVAALASRGPLWGAQFHPEKSGATGLACWPTSSAWPPWRRRDGAATRPSTCAAARPSASTQGDFDREARYGDPVDARRRATSRPARRWMHVVDLDAARTGVPHERAVLDEIVRLAADAAVCVEAGGGVRTEDDAAELLESGVARVVLGHGGARGSRAGRAAVPVAGPGGSRSASTTASAPDGVAEAQAQGWLAGSGRAVDRPARRCGRASPSAPWWRPSVARDGMLAGPDLDGLRALLAATSLPVRGLGWRVGASRTWRPWPGSGRRAGALAGAIVGKAIVEGRLTVEEGLAACAASA